MARERSGGVQFEDDGRKGPGFFSDLTRLIDELKSSEDRIDKDDKDRKGGTIPRDPRSQERTLLSRTSLALVIPSGFLLVHNDLREILDALTGSGVGAGKSKKSEESSTTWQDVSLAGINKGASLIGLGMGLEVLKQWTTGMNLNQIFDSIIGFSKNAIDLLPAAGKAVGQAVHEMGGSLVMLLADIGSMNSDPDIQRIHKASQGSYLVAYYSDMMKSMGYELEYSFDGDGIPIIEGMSKKTSYTDAEMANIVWEKGTEALGHFMTGGVGPGIEAVTKSVTNAVNTALPSLIGAYDMLTDPEAQKAISRMSILMSQASMAKMIYSMGYDVDFSDPDNPTISKYQWGKNEMEDIMKSAEMGLDAGKEIAGHAITLGIGPAAEAISSSIGKVVTNLMGSISTIALMDDNPYLKESVSPLLARYASVMVKTLMNQVGYDVDINDPSMKVTKYTLGNKVSELDSARGDDIVKEFNALSSLKEMIVGGIKGLTESAMSPITGAYETIGKSTNQMVTNLEAGLTMIGQIDKDDELRRSLHPLMEKYYSYIIKDMFDAIGYDLDVSTYKVTTKNRMSLFKIEKTTDIGDEIYEMAASESTTGYNSVFNNSTVVSARVEGMSSFLKSYYSAISRGINDHASEIITQDVAKKMGTDFRSSWGEYLKKIEKSTIEVNVNEGIRNAMSEPVSLILGKVDEVKRVLFTLQDSLSQIRMSIRDTDDPTVSSLLKDVASSVDRASAGIQGSILSGTGGQTSSYTMDESLNGTTGS